MHAAVVQKLGTPPRCERFPEPIAGANEIIVHVLAASLKPVDKQMVAGSHYASPRSLPFICGTDGVGRLESGERVFFGGCRTPYGAMAQLTVVPTGFVFPIPPSLSDEAARRSLTPEYQHGLPSHFGQNYVLERTSSSSVRQVLRDNWL